MLVKGSKVKYVTWNYMDKNHNETKCSNANHHNFFSDRNILLVKAIKLYELKQDKRPLISWLKVFQSEQCKSGLMIPGRQLWRWRSVIVVCTGDSQSDTHSSLPMVQWSASAQQGSNISPVQFSQRNWQTILRNIWSYYSEQDDIIVSSISQSNIFFSTLTREMENCIFKLLFHCQL